MTGILTKRKLCLFLTAFLALSLLCAAVSSPAQAYFTSYTPAFGGRTVYDRTEIDINEKVENMVKTVSVENTGEVDCWVRVLLVYPEGCSVNVSGTDWQQKADGFWYYKNPVPVGASTPSDSGNALKVGISVSGSARQELQKEFNVVVISECVPVTYAVDGSLSPSSWDQVDWAMKEQ